METWRKIVVVVLFLGFALGVAGVADGPPALIEEPEGGTPECTSCSAGKDVPQKDVPQPRWQCPIRITVECWCELPQINEYVCCTYMVCGQWDLFGACTNCIFETLCYWIPCDSDPPEFATFPGRQPL